MALSEKQLRWIEEGIRLAVAAVIAAVRASKDQEAMDWSALRITETPEMALEKARKKKSADDADDTDEKREKADPSRSLP
ncbi:MAG: hypothetical protein HY647_01715 [Acidobacteria bacterium]|nr:hypothetical protein [Acidobacteriota bacterium]